ncbi:hypothetical protein GH5_03564 [Leishmania sp. Ghana 2012 LV757]|uniref:hypothetical protein n=1 Tax=Leishmania sp. Ghana 2012 LV757 TaxID=2803181 RepID=UPI001B624539|nr:hypothetical protein GH5_03564 [Leishmania sp. Ghana 2012 LV757]
MAEEISGLPLPKTPNARRSDSADPYVTMFLEVLSMDSTPKAAHAIGNNGFHLVWCGAGQTGWTWTVDRWPMATLMLHIYDRDKHSTCELLAEAIIPQLTLYKSFSKVLLNSHAG